MNGLPFVKMHGCGNDYIYLDGFRDPLPHDPAALAREMSDRHRGIGGDGLILLIPSAGENHQAQMRMFNADGSESEMCGNGLRCLAALARQRGHVPQDCFAVATGAGVLSVAVAEDGPGRFQVAVEMGPPRLAPADIPLDLRDEPLSPQGTIELELPPGNRLSLRPLSMGNPHAVAFVEDLAAVPVAEWGPMIEHLPIFPRRCNVEFVQRLADDAQGQPVLRQRTWERGSGITMACGTGACAVAVAAILEERIPGREVRVDLDGGSLWISWPGELASVTMRGEAVWVYEGHWPMPGPQGGP